MDAATVLGLTLSLGGILLGNFIDGGHIASLIQGTAALIVFGGTFGAVLMSHGMPDVRLAIRLFKRSMRNQALKDRKRIAQELITASQTARRESLLSLETKINGFSSSYMKNVFRYMIDGVEAESLKKIFDSEMQVTETRLMQGVKVWNDAGGFAPTVGILGAVLGLIHVMSNLSDTSALGRGIAVAFVATIYGVGSANLIFIPIANKVRKSIKIETEIKHMIVEAAIGIASGLNPYIIEEKMRSYTELPL